MHAHNFYKVLSIVSISSVYSYIFAIHIATVGKLLSQLVNILR